MDTLVYFISLLCSFGILQSILVVYALYQYQNERIWANRFLAAMILCVSLRIVKPLLVLFAQLPFLFENTGIACMLLAMPLFFLHLQAILENRQKLLPTDWLHILPFTFYLLTSWNIDVFRTEIYSLIMAHNLVYFGAGVYLVWSHQKAHPTTIYNWTIGITAGTGIIWAGFVYAWIFHPPITGMLYTATTGYSMLILILSYLIYNKKSIFATAAAPKYKRSKIDLQRSKKLFDELLRLITSEKLYLDADLTLQTVASRIGISAREVSQIVNENTQTNFSDWLNGFRVNEAKQRLVDDQYQTYKIAAIAFDCGFNTLSSFNTIFKAKTGYTPSEYRNFHRLNLN